MNKHCANYQDKVFILALTSETISILTTKYSIHSKINSIYPSCSVGVYKFVAACAQVWSRTEKPTQSEAKIIYILQIFFQYFDTLVTAPKNILIFKRHVPPNIV